MKLLKEILIFMAFTGVIFGIFTFVTKEREAVNTAALSAGNHEQIIKEIDRDWSNLSDWDEDTYNRHNTMVAQSLNAGIINDLDSRTLHDRINKAAYQKCVAAMNREFDRADCDPDKLADNYGGLQTVLMNERGLATNNQIVEVSKVYNLYNRIIAFNKKSLKMNPQFNGTGRTWNSWTGHQDRIYRQKNDFISDPIFLNRLRNITTIQEIYNTDSRLRDAREQFYDRLGNEICAYYDGRLRQIDASAQQDDANSSSAAKSALCTEINGIRVNIANEKYVNPNHHIFSRLHRLYNRIKS